MCVGTTERVLELVASEAFNPSLLGLIQWAIWGDVIQTY